MLYWEEMQTKHGFNSGQLEPPGRHHYRRVYVKAMNYLLELYGSALRVISFNHDGGNNGCRILTVSVSMFNGLSEKEVLDGVDRPPGAGLLPKVKYDDQWDEAIEAAGDMFLDDFVESKFATLDNDLQVALMATRDHHYADQSKASP